MDEEQEEESRVGEGTALPGVTSSERVEGGEVAGLLEAVLAGRRGGGGGQGGGGGSTGR
jgi:hypothetical protein